MRRAIGTLVAVVLLGGAGCGGGGGTDHVRELTALDKAITAVNTARSAVVAEVSKVTDAVRRLDAADVPGVKGDKTALRTARPAARQAVALVVPALRAVSTDADRYAAALSALDAVVATPGLNQMQRNSLRTVVILGRVEADRSRAFGRVATGLWPQFRAFDAAQDLWLQRASNGWYRSVQEGANAYVVLSRRTELQTARRTLEQADAARTEAATSTSAAMTGARGMLAPLLPSTSPS